MRQYTPKRAEQNKAAAPIRQSLKARVRRCEWCGEPAKPEELTLHEIAGGNPLRRLLQDKPFGLLCVHWIKRAGDKLVACHAQLQLETRVKQLARLKLVRPDSYDVEAFNRIVRPYAPESITEEEVEAAAMELRETMPWLAATYVKDFG
jgi:hypothetical protein